MARRLFSELSPQTDWLSVKRMILQRRIRNVLAGGRFARSRDLTPLPVTVYVHNSLIRRRLGNVDLELQENKAVTLGLAAPHINGILIRPGETFSFWELVGHCTARKGYRMGLTISHGGPDFGIADRMCQFTNLLHWMVLNSPLDVVEHHHHGELDLFPDFNRQIPFGTGTSIVYNYLDYRVQNTTDTTFQFQVHVTEEYLRGELRAVEPLAAKYHVTERGAYFYERDGKVYRHNRIFRSQRDRRTGNELGYELLLENDALVMYGRDLIRSRIHSSQAEAIGATTAVAGPTDKAADITAEAVPGPSDNVGMGQASTAAP